MDILREVIHSCQQCTLLYKARGTQKQSKQLVYPYGFIFGHRHYLLAYSPLKKEYRYFSLANIQEVQISDEYFTRDDNFSLLDYMKNAFGVYQELPQKIHLKFTKTVAEDIKNYQFHPTQKITTCDDGSVDVIFKAGGLQEICWHLFTWGKYVKIIKPALLKQIYQNMLKEIFDHHS